MKKFSLNSFTFMSRSDKNNNLNKSSLIGVGYTMCGGMAFFAIGGYFLDKKLEIENVFTLIGVFLGLFYCGYEIWKLTRE